MKENKYIELGDEHPSPSGLTSIWPVLSRNNGEELGTIQWYGLWRQYTFWPRDRTTFNPSCLDTISAWCAELTRRHRESRAAPGRT